MVSVIGFVVIITAATLSPYNEDGTPRRNGTHLQLGLPPCGFMTLTKTPCPGCGMTTAFAFVVRGEISSGLSANWVGVLIAALTIMITAGATAAVFLGPTTQKCVDWLLTRCVPAVGVAAIVRWAALLFLLK